MVNELLLISFMPKLKRDDGLWQKVAAKCGGAIVVGIKKVH